MLKQLYFKDFEVLYCHFRKFINSLIQGYLPGLALKLFLVVVPWILMLMSKVEGFVSLSSLERRAASKYFIFLVISVFFGSILTGSASQQLSKMVHEPPTRYKNILISTI